MDFDHNLDKITPDLQNVLTIGGTGGLVLASGTTAQQPSSPSAGTIRWNLSLLQLEAYNGTGWVQYTPAAGATTTTISNNNCILFGTSYYVHQMAVSTTAAGGVVVSTSTFTVTTTNTHYLLPGMQIFGSAPSGSVGVDTQWLYGTITSISGNTLTCSTVAGMPALIPGTSTVAFEFTCAQRFAPSSSFRAANNLLNAPLNLKVCFAQSGIGTANLIPMINNMLSFTPGVIIGDFAIWNDVEANSIGTTSTGGLANLMSMLVSCLTTGAKVIFEGWAAATFATATQASLAAEVMSQVNALAKAWPGLLIFDKWKLTVNPLTGVANADMFQPDGEHPSPKSAQVYAIYLAELMEQASIRSPQSPIANSINDRHAAYSSSYQLYDGGWSATGQNAATQDANASGVLDSQAVFGIYNNTTNNSKAVCSLVPRADGFGYDQVITVTRTSLVADGYHQTLLGFSNFSGTSLVSLMAAGGTYQFAADISLTSSTMSTLYRYNVIFSVTFSSPAVETRVGLLDSSDYDSGLYPYQFHETMICPAVTIPSSGYTLSQANGIITVYTQGPGSFTLRVGRVTVRKMP